jgi:hypothetical protein
VAHRDGAVPELLGLDGEDPADGLPAPTSDLVPRRRPPHVGPAGAASDGFARDLVTAIEAVLAVPEERRREAAVGRAASLPWSATADGLLAALGVPSGARSDAPPVAARDGRPAPRERVVGGSAR